MAATKSRPWPPSGYPALQLVERGCAIIAATKPDPVYLTVSAKLHNLGIRKTTALLQVFDIATKAAQWMLRDIQRHAPLRLFAAYRKRNSSSYNTDAIADEISRRYREYMRSRFSLNSSVFSGLCSHLGSMISSWLQKMTEAERKGYLRRYQECAKFVVEFGRHCGKPLKALPRDVIFGFAFLQPTQAQLERAAVYLDALINGLPEDTSLREEAMQYRLEFGRRRNKTLRSMRPVTWRRLRLVVQRDLDRLEQMERVRQVAQDFLRYKPDSFPSIKSGVLSPVRRCNLVEEYREALDAYGALPSLGDDDEAIAALTEDERGLFRDLQQRAYVATNHPKYVTLQWDRADGAVRGRDGALLYEPAGRRYLFLVV